MVVFPEITPGELGLEFTVTLIEEEDPFPHSLYEIQISLPDDFQFTDAPEFVVVNAPELVGDMDQE
jgi:hypothetical protein